MAYQRQEALIIGTKGEQHAIPVLDRHLITDATGSVSGKDDETSQSDRIRVDTLPASHGNLSKQRLRGRQLLRYTQPSNDQRSKPALTPSSR